MFGRSNQTIMVCVAFIAGILLGVIMPKTFLLFISCIVCLIIGVSILFSC